MKKVFTKKAPEPAGHYSQAIIHRDTIYVSGQLPIYSETGEKCTGSIEDQAAVALNNVLQILNSAGSSKEKVIKMTVYISDITLWDRVNKVYAECFGDHKPARAIVPTKDLHYGFKIEIDAIAAI